MTSATVTRDGLVHAKSWARPHDAARRHEAEMAPALRRDHAPARGPHQETLLDQEGFQHILDRAKYLAAALHLVPGEGQIITTEDNVL